jgi:hypothetical protein
VALVVLLGAIVPKLSKAVVAGEVSVEMTETGVVKLGVVGVQVTV